MRAPRVRSSDGRVPKSMLSAWLSYAKMGIRGPRCVEPSVLARERPSDRLHGLELSCISEGWRPCARPTARNVSKPVSCQCQHSRLFVQVVSAAKCAQIAFVGPEAFELIWRNFQQEDFGKTSGGANPLISGGAAL